MHNEKFKLYNNQICLPNLDKKYDKFRAKISKFKIIGGSYQTSESEIDHCISEAKSIEDELNQYIEYYERNGNKAEFPSDIDFRTVSFFDALGYLNMRLKVVEMDKYRLESNYMRAAENQFQGTHQSRNIQMNNYVDNYSDSEVESLEHALQYVNDGISEIDSEWKTDITQKHRAQIASKVESLRIFKRDIKKRLKEARRIEDELQRMEQQIQQQHSNRMEELNMERKIEKMRMKRQQQAQNDMEDLMSQFQNMMNG